MKEILIAKNCSREGPGLFADVLKQNALPFRLVDLENQDPFPDPRDYSALIILGGPDSANDNSEKIQNELLRVKEALHLEIPTFGVCLGLQLLVKAGGGKVLGNPVKEIGFRDGQNEFFRVDLTEEGIADPLSRGIEPSFRIFQLHGETVSLTPQMTLLGTGKFCQNQLVRIGPSAYGIQGHLEIDRNSIQDWMEQDADLRILSPRNILDDANALLPELTATGRKIFLNFLRHSKLVPPK